MKLRWEACGPGIEGAWGFSGELAAALVIRWSVNNPDDRWQWKLELRTKYVCAGEGEVKSKAAAMRSAERAWGKWLAHAALVPSSETPHCTTS